MRNSIRYIVSLVAGGLATSCAYSTPYQTSGPVVAKEGVQLAVAGDRCYVNRSGEQYPTTVDDDQLHVDVNLKVINQSDRVAVLSLDALQLENGTAPTSTVMHPTESGSVSLSPGESKLVPLAFEEHPQFDHPGVGDCHSDLVLDAERAVAIDGKPVSLASIRFQPVH